MKQWIGLVAIALFGGLVFAAPVDAEKATAVALAFAEQNAILANHTEGVGEATSWENVWVVPLKPSGYVAIEMDDVRPPVIGFGKEDFPEEPAPPMVDLLKRPAVEEGLTTLSVAPAHGEWAELLASEGGVTTLAASPVPPSEATVMKVGEIKDFTYAWTQCLPYNLYSPGISYARLGEANKMKPYTMTVKDYGTLSASGCVATAFAQVAAWFQWPYALQGVMSHKQQARSGYSFATHQVAAPGEPYDWKTIAASISLDLTDEKNGEEVGRFVQHWATLAKMIYLSDGTSGAYSTNIRPHLSRLAGYKIVFPESASKVSLVYVENDLYSCWYVGEAPVSSKSKAFYDSFEEMIYTHQMPAEVSITGHAIVCCGWAEDVDTVLSAETRYVKLNYGWSPSRGMNGWFAIRTATGSGESVMTSEDNNVYLLDNNAILPLQCGEILNLSAQDTVSETVQWYESPYWAKRYPTAERYLQVATFNPTEKGVKLSLEAASKSDANWFYTPAKMEPEEPERLALDHTRAMIITAARFPELIKAASTNIKVEVALERFATQYKIAEPGVAEEDLTTYEGYVLDGYARELFVALEDITTGAIVASQKVMLDEKEIAGTCEVNFEVEEGKVFRVLLMTDNEMHFLRVLQMSLDTLAYTVTGVTVVSGYEEQRVSYAFESVDVPTKEDEPGTLSVGTLSEETVAALNAKQEMWLAVTIATEAEPKVYDAIWTPVTIGQRVEPPEVKFTAEHFFLNDVEDPITFTMTGTDIQSVTAYLSQASWLNDTSSEGFELTETERTVANEEGVFTFTLAGRANTDADALDTLTVESYESVGRNAVLSLRVEDACGNVDWTHTRVTWGLSDELVALAGDSLRTVNLHKLLYSAIYAGCFEKVSEPGGDTFALKEDGETSKATVSKAMKIVEDAVRLGFGKTSPTATEEDAAEQAAAQERLFNALLLNDPIFNPRVEVLSVTPEAITFRLSDGVTEDAGVLARQVSQSAMTVEGGETLDAIKQLLPEEMTLTCDTTTGIYTLTLPTDKRFFQIKL